MCQSKQQSDNQTSFKPKLKQTSLEFDLLLENQKLKDDKIALLEEKLQSFQRKKQSNKELKDKVDKLTEENRILAEANAKLMQETVEKSEVIEELKKELCRAQGKTIEPQEILTNFHESRYSKREQELKREE